MKFMICLISACWWVAIVSGGEDCIGLDELGLVDTGGWVSSVVVLDGYAFVTRSSGGGMDVIDVSDPLLPAVVGSYETEFPAQQVVEDGGVVYVRTYDDDGRRSYFHVVDVSAPTTPVLVERHSIAGRMNDMDVEGEFAYFAAGKNGLYIFDLMYGYDSPYTSNHSATGYFNDVRVESSIAYVGFFNIGMELIDVSTPAPVSLGSTHLLGEPVVVGSVLYGIDPYDFRVFAVDVSNPSAPIVLGSVEPSLGIPSQLVVRGDTVFVSMGIGSHTEVYDFSDPTMPVLIGMTETNGYVGEVVGDRLYVAGLFEGLKILDARDECAGVCAADLTGEGDLNFLDVSAFLAAYGSGDLVADFSSDGMLNFLDVSAFLSEFSGGCP